MGALNSQLTIIFSAKYQLTTIFWPAVNSQLTANFGQLLTFTQSYSKYYSVVTRIFFTSARQSLLGVGPSTIYK